MTPSHSTVCLWESGFVLEFFIVLLSEIGSYCVTLASLEFAAETGLAWSSRDPPVSAVCFHSWPAISLVFVLSRGSGPFIVTAVAYPTGCVLLSPYLSYRVHSRFLSRLCVLTAHL